MKAQEWIENLQLKAHPEGGFFREIYRSDERIAADALPGRFKEGRKFATSIYYLLDKKDISAFHKIKQDEIWHHYDGKGCEVFIIFKDGSLIVKKLGLDVENDCHPQIVVPRNTWFAARNLDEESFSLMGCTVAPGFEFDDMELAETESLLAEYPEHAELIKQLS